jgi:ATP-dependent Zn protease
MIRKQTLFIKLIIEGRALGATFPWMRNIHSKEYLEAMITYQWKRGSRKACFNGFTTGTGNDIERSAQIARKMVCEWGIVINWSIDLWKERRGDFPRRNFTAQDYSNKQC